MEEKNTNWQKSVCAVVLREGKVLLARHTYGAGKGLFITPGGYLKNGESPEQAVKEVGMVVEGINALPAAMELAAKYNVEMPIVQTVNAIVKEGMSASDALRTLMDRNRKNEMPQGYEKV